MPPAWQPDVLGPSWQARTLRLQDDDEGPVVATLVRRAPGPAPVRPDGTRHGARPAVLYVHGFNDYFFQAHLAAQWEAHGYSFYALDLRKCGRSWRSWQTPHYCLDLCEFTEELTTAAHLIRGALGHDLLVVHAHSTGGLTASLWAHSMREAGVVDALVLNSPFLDLNTHGVRRLVQRRVLGALGSVDPRRVVAHRPSPYSSSLHVTNGGEWEYDVTLKHPDGAPMRAGFAWAAVRGHARLLRGLAISAPVLVCSAQRSSPNRLGNPDLHRTDTVLDVRQIEARAPLLGPDVTYVPIADGIHDLALSPRPARDRYFGVVFDWLADRVVTGDAAGSGLIGPRPWHSVG